MSDAIAPAHEIEPEAPERAGSLRDAAYEAIKHRIITCAFRPGEYLNEAHVCATLKLGRTPVHQALDRLMHEGMVDVIPRKGVIVRPVDLAEILQIIEVRLINEGHGVRLAAERAEPDDIAQMEDVLRRSERAMHARDSEEMMRLDREFHHLIGRASKNAVLAGVLSRLHDRELRHWFISLTRPGHHASVHAQHQEILAALRARDGAAADAAMRAHIDSFRRNLLDKS
ncbi:MAG TPA: GntR family transcriptional regulator [Beijerinckiaceae bacterium]|jgi:DNA-binding GntR family transcriptional regulator